MAPALSLAPEPPDQDSDINELFDNSQCNGRQVLAPVDNLANPESDVMGLQSQPLVKNPQTMDQMLVDFSGNDILQVMKTFENNNDALSTGDPESIFPLDLPETVDSESESPEDKIKVSQARIERRCAFLLRRLRILQARAIGKRISEEVAQTFEKCTKGARKDGGGRPMGLKALLKRVETTAALQASAASKSSVGPKYYGASTSKCDAAKSATVGISSGTLTGLEDTAGALRSHLSLVKKELDSDATASSSGADSNDEAVVYNNPHQQHMPLEKRALWSWQRERASIASRWSWLQAQVQELEYKIRQHNDLHKQVREAKGPVEFEGEPVGYEGSLPGADAAPDETSDIDSCARVRPLRRETFKKRKLLQMHNLHIATNKAAKPSDIRCRCQFGAESCPVCTGRAEPTLGAAEPEPTPRQRRAADPAYHPVLSDLKDVSAQAHLSELIARPWFRARRAPARAPAPPPPPATPHKHTNKHHKMKRGRPPLSRKIKERERDEEHSTENRARGRASTESRAWRRQSYDIDNIVIPQSVAANTRPQILTYKEIITPKWRVMEIPDVPMNNGISKSYRMSIDDEFQEDSDEDVSEEAVRDRHARAETRERARYTRGARHSALDRAPSDRLPADRLPADRQPPDRQSADRQSADRHSHDGQPLPVGEEAVRPYSPRSFPLRSPPLDPLAPRSPRWSRSRSRSASRSGSRSRSRSRSGSRSSSVSALSAAYEGDDPDDHEWEPNKERSDRRKAAFR